MESLVTVIVPFYNTEKYACQCIDSIIMQSYKNLEIILVDDESPDFCGRICDDYAKSDNRVKVIHKKNGGLSDARNAGLDICTGDYVTFVDSDDCIDNDYIKKMLDISLREDADIVQSQYTYYLKELGGNSPSHADMVIETSGRAALANLLLRKDANEAACAKLYKKSVIGNIRFPVGRINEDTLTTYKFLYQCKKIVFISDYLYYYRYNPNGILHSQFSEKRFTILSVFDEIDNYLGDDRQSLTKELMYYRIRRTLFFYNQCIALGAEKKFKTQLISIRKQIKSYRRYYYLLEPKYRALVLILNTCPYIYNFLVINVRKKEREYSDALIQQTESR